MIGVFSHGLNLRWTLDNTFSLTRGTGLTRLSFRHSRKSQLGLSVTIRRLSTSKRASSTSRSSMLSGC